MKQNLVEALRGIENGGRTLATLALTLIAISGVLGIINLSGLGIVLSDSIAGVAGANIYLGVLVTALICLILGMGMTTTGAYLIALAVAGTTLIRLGQSPLAVHMLCLYTAALSSITPPVCVASYVAAAIAKTSWFGVAVNAVKLAAVGFMLSLVFVFHPALLMEGSAATIALSFILAILGSFLLAIGFTGYFSQSINVFSRILFSVSGFLFLLPYWETRATGGGLALVGAVVIYLDYRWRTGMRPTFK
jgi:TRAP-type uncharacterized transport system fused permease subunit